MAAPLPPKQTCLVLRYSRLCASGNQAARLQRVGSLPHGALADGAVFSLAGQRGLASPRHRRFTFLSSLGNLDMLSVLMRLDPFLVYGVAARVGVSDLQLPFPRAGSAASAIDVWW